MEKNIIFDFGCVLLDWNPHYVYDKYFGNAEKAQWFLDNICNMAWNVEIDAGKPIVQGVADSRYGACPTGVRKPSPWCAAAVYSLCSTVTSSPAMSFASSPALKSTIGFWTSSA